MLVVGGCLVGRGRVETCPYHACVHFALRRAFREMRLGLVWGGVKSERLNFVMGFGGVMVGLTLGFSTSDCHAPDACACGSAHFCGYPGWRFEGKGQWDGG